MGSRVQLHPQVSMNIDITTRSSLLFFSQLTATADTYLGCGVPETPLGRNLPVFHVLYELVVPAWPLFLWVVYRTRAND
jgi:hypothetical protein